jgi:hypothetical protein
VSRLALALAAVTLAAAAGAQHAPPPARCERAPADRVERLRADVAWLADDARAGREPGTAGGRATEAWLVERFTQLGLLPAGTDGYRQTFRVEYGSEETRRAQVLLRARGETRALALGADFRVAHVPRESGNGRAVGPLVYVGHGLVSREADWSDFARGVSVRGRIAVALSGPPRPADVARAAALQRAHVLGSLHGKVRAARQAGAVALIEIALDDDGLAGGYVAPPSTGIPVVRISRAQGAWLLGRDLAAMVPETAEVVAARLPTATARVVTATQPRWVTASNVLGLVRGADSASRGAFVVGAHQDHVGYGGGSSLAPGVHAIHNGADDNASGTSVVLELARSVARAPLRRDVVFALFAAEELGLVGSRWLVQHRPPALGDITAVMNLDMVGRLRDCRLFVEARETARAFAPAVEAANAGFGFDARPWEPSRGEWGASDHMSFIEARVPGLFLFTGLHDEYHRPADDPPTLNHRGLGAVAGFAEALLRGVDAAAAQDAAGLRFNAR